MSLSSDQILAIQANGIDATGQPLKRDGLWGPKTAWWYGITQLSITRQELLRLLLGYHVTGMKEDSKNPKPNDGSFVDGLLEPAGLRYAPWCVALVSNSFRKLGIPLPEYFVSTYRLIEWAKQTGRLTTAPVPGDIEAFLYPRVPGEDRKGHARVITGYDVTTKVSAGVDGNVGDAVRVGLRRDRPERYFIRMVKYPGVGDMLNGYQVMPSGLMYLDDLGDR